LFGPQNEDRTKTVERLATEDNVSRATIERDGQFTEAVDPFAKDQGPFLPCQIVTRKSKEWNVKGGDSMRRSSARVLIALWLCRLSTSYAADNSLLRPPTEASQRVVLGIPLGAPRHQVEAIFTEAKIPELRRDTGMTVYKEPPAKIKNGGATILLFHEDKLAKVALLIDTESQTAEPYIFRYQELKESLSEKYGQPKTSTEYIDENYRTDSGAKYHKWHC
jgi:hypothetical protein